MDLGLDQVGSQGVETSALRQSQVQQLHLFPAHQGPLKVLTHPQLLGKSVPQHLEQCPSMSRGDIPHNSSCSV